MDGRSLGMPPGMSLKLAGKCLAGLWIFIVVFEGGETKRGDRTPGRWSREG